MSYSELMLSESSIISPIEQSGNFFIMDSEQLVSNPFQDMKEEAMDNAKKQSLTEKLTSVKNNVCENHLQLRSHKLQSDITHKLKQLHDNTSQLRYEAKVYDINKRKTDLENRKRIDPYRDFSYDETQLKNSTKRLGVVTNCFYLEKKQQYPIRGRMTNDLHPTAVVREARQVFRQREQQSRLDYSRGDMCTPGTTVSSAKSKRSVPWSRRDSKSAPPTAKLSQSIDIDDRTTKLPSLDKKPNVSFVIDRKTPDPMDRAKTYHPGMNIKPSKAWSNDGSVFEENDEDYIDLDKLRSVIFGSKYSQSSRSGFDTPRTMASFQSSSYSRRPTQEALKKEQQELQHKIDDFFGNLNDQDNEELVEEVPSPQEVKPPPAMSKANLMLSIFARSVAAKEWKDTDSAVESKVDNQKDEGERIKSSLSQRSKSPYSVTIKPEPKQRDMWKYIKTSVQRGEIQRCQTPSKLIIEQMTHLDLTNSDKKHIPLKSANRALRHTPTFKMRQLVQRMQRERTKYEQFEIDQKKTKMQDGQMEGVEVMS